MKKTLFLIIGFIFNILIVNANDSQAIIISTEECNIPEGITYNKASDENNLFAIEYLKSLINQSQEILTNLPDMIMIGPRLWSALRNYEEIAASPTIPVDYLIPLGEETIKADGAIVKSELRTFYVINLFMDLLRDRELIIRKLNENELRYYWAICAWDLEEPIFVVETKNVGKYLFNFLIDKVSYIEDITGLR